MNAGPPLGAGVVARVKGFARSVRADKGAMLLIPTFVVYVLAWSYITILKFYALHATVFDLGLEMEQLWKFVHPVGFTASSYVVTALDQPFQFLLSPISLPVNYPLLLVIQSVGLGSGTFAVYGISRTVLGKPVASFCLALAYLLYFPLGGVNWFDFHAQAFFVPLFLWGFFCYATRRYRLALALLMLAAGVTYSYVLLVVLFSALSIVEIGLRRAFLGQKQNAFEWKFFAILLIASVAFFLYQYAVYTYLIGIGFSQNAVILTGSISLSNRLQVIVLLLVPMLFLPAFSPKWLAMLVPFFYLELRSAAMPFNFPTIFQIQFTSLAIPFVFIGGIYGIRTIDRLLARRKAQRVEEGEPPRSLHRLLRRPGRSTGLAMVVLVVTIGCAMVFEPYGPFNGCCGDDFRFGAATDVNMSYFDEYVHLVGLIPSDTPYVLFQNNMPSVLPRPLEYEGAPLVTGLESWVNATSFDAASNRFPLELVQGRLAYVPLSFAISDPNNRWYSSGGNVSMYSFFTTMYQSGFYGLVGEASGMTLLARGYDGPLQYYDPFTETASCMELFGGGPNTLCTGSALSVSNLTGQAAWTSGYFSLSPGTYRIGFSLSTSSVLPQNTLKLFVVANHTRAIILANATLSGENFSGPDVWTTFDLTLRLTTAWTDVQFEGQGTHWAGTISIRSIAVAEIDPPSSIFTGVAGQETPESVTAPD